MKRLDLSLVLPMVGLLALMAFVAAIDPLQNSPLIALVEKSIFFAISLCLFAYQSWVVANRGSDWLTGLRIRILVGIGLGIITQIPGTIFQLIKLNDEVPNQFIAALTTFTTNLTPIILILLFVWFFTYRKRDNK